MNNLNHLALQFNYAKTALILQWPFNSKISGERYFLQTKMFSSDSIT